MQGLNPSRINNGSDALGRYYTDSIVGSLLVRSMSQTFPEKTLDLGSGDGVLVGEASKIWTSSNFITVDIDSSAKSALLPNQNSAFSHYIGDALNPNLSDEIGVRLGEVDKAVCNPPYIRPKWRKQFASILEDAGLSHIFPSIRDVPADILFIAQNLRFLKSGGQLGLILPDGIIAGESFLNFRKALIENHHVEHIIELPRRIFKATDAKAHIMILSKEKKSYDNIKIQSLGISGELSSQLSIPIDQAIQRLDYSFQSKKSNIAAHGSQRKIRNFVEYITRGKYSSVDKKNSVFPIFHTTDMPKDSIFVPHKFLLKNKIQNVIHTSIALKGDILVARVGRNLSQKICMVQEGSVVVSDCFFIIRAQPEYRAKVFEFLLSGEGRSKLNDIAHGVGASFITTNAILDICF